MSAFCDGREERMGKNDSGCVAFFTNIRVRPDSHVKLVAVVACTFMNADQEWKPENKRFQDTKHR